MIKISITKEDMKKGNWIKLGIGLLVGLLGIFVFVYLLNNGLLTFTLGR